MKSGNPKIRLSAVSYLNTKPFIYGLFKSPLADRIELSLDIPAVCAQKLLHGEVDLALTPVAIIPELPEAWLVSDYCIGSINRVKTVCLYSNVPLLEIDNILLDFHSRTSVALCKILCAEYWHIRPQFIPAQPGFEADIQGRTAAVLIGDRSIGLERQYQYVYDLGEAWHSWTGLPFVFAGWISTRPPEHDFVKVFNQALKTGLEHIPQLIQVLPTMPNFDLKAYFEENISYALDDPKWEALNRYLNYLAPAGYKLHRNVSEPTMAASLEARENQKPYAGVHGNV